MIPVSTPTHPEYRLPDRLVLPVVTRGQAGGRGSDGRQGHLAKHHIQPLVTAGNMAGLQLSITVGMLKNTFTA